MSAFQAQVKTGPSITVTVSAGNLKDLVNLVGMAQEILGESECGLCKSKSIRYRKRVVGDNDFYECVCDNCGARLSLGQNKKDKEALFPNRKLDKDGKPDFKKGTFGPHRGWSKYKGEPTGEE